MVVLGFPAEQNGRQVTLQNEYFSLVHNSESIFAANPVN